MAYAMGGEKSRIRSAAPGEAFSAGELIALASDGLLYKANAAAGASQQIPACGLAEIAATATMVTNGTKVCYVGDCDYVTGATGLTPGATVWAGATDGIVTTTRPSAHSTMAQAVGQAITATTWILDIDDAYEQIGVTS